MPSSAQLAVQLVQPVDNKNCVTHVYAPKTVTRKAAYSHILNKVHLLITFHSKDILFHHDDYTCRFYIKLIDSITPLQY